LLNYAREIPQRISAKAEFGPFSVNAPGGHRDGSGDVTAHAEAETIRKAVATLNPEAPSITTQNQNDSTLEIIPRPEGSPDLVPERAKMLNGHEIFISEAPCPMCMSAIYWARIDSVFFAQDLDATSSIGFDDQFQDEDFAKPYPERGINISQFRPDLGEVPYKTWAEKPDRHPYGPGEFPGLSRPSARGGATRSGHSRHRPADEARARG
jgi:guanine deaminase